MLARSGNGTGAPSGAARSQSPAAAEPNRVSICVLPFSNMSGDAEQVYFSDGITEDIITDLSKVSSLAVVSRNTAFSLKGKNIDIAQITRQLKVSYVLEGSVRKAAGRVRITAQLIEGAKDNHVWAERYDRDLSDIFALQDEISQAIVKALKLKLLPEEKKAIEQREPRGLQPVPDGAAVQRDRELWQRAPLRGDHPPLPQRDGDRSRLCDRLGADGCRAGRPQVLFQRPRRRRARRRGTRACIGRGRRRRTRAAASHRRCP
jgi:TolB-like protein